MNKLFVAFAVLGAVLLASQTVSCEDDKPVDELYILNPGSLFPVVVTDPQSPLLQEDSSLSPERRQVIRICIASQCNSVCRSWGFRIGLCNTQAVCVCLR